MAIKVRQEQESQRAPPNKKRKVDNQILVNIDKQQVIGACVSLVAVSGQPLRVYEDPGLRMLLDPILWGFSNSFSMTSESVVHRIKEEASKLRNILKSQVANRLICLKVNGAKRLSRSIISIKIQFVELETEVAHFGCCQANFG